MSRRVKVNPEPLFFVALFFGTDGQDLLFTIREIIDPHIQVHLLRMLRRGPVRRSQLIHPLECQGRAVVRSIADGDPFSVRLNPLHPEEFFIKPGHGFNVFTIDHKCVPFSNHAFDYCLQRGYLARA